MCVLGVSCAVCCVLLYALCAVCDVVRSVCCVVVCSTARVLGVQCVL